MSWKLKNEDVKEKIKEMEEVMVRMISLRLTIPINDKQIQNLVVTATYLLVDV